MALRVGMRVKKVRDRAYIHPIGVHVGVVGDEGIIVCMNSETFVEKTDACLVRWNSGQESTVADYMIEPIQPEGHKPIEWSQCLWQPEHIREGVSA